MCISTPAIAEISSRNRQLALSELRCLLHQSPDIFALTILLLSCRESTEKKIGELARSLNGLALGPRQVQTLLIRLEHVVDASHQLCQYLRLHTESSPKQPPLNRLSFAERVLRNIHRGLANEDFDTTQLAKEMAMSRAQLYRKFSLLGYSTPAKLILRCRLERAAFLLQQEEQTVTSVTFEVGLKSLPHFSRSFRLHFGIPPSTWHRRTMQAGHRAHLLATTRKTYETKR